MFFISVQRSVRLRALVSVRVIRAMAVISVCVAVLLVSKLSLAQTVDRSAQAQDASGGDDNGPAGSADGDIEMADARWAEAFWATPEVVRRATEKIQPCVVAIESFGGVTTTAGVIGGIRKQGEGNTTGLIVSRQGLVVTSLFNFVRSPRIITVILPSGERKSAQILGKDMTRNLCLLQIEDADDLPVPEFIPNPEMEVGRYAISLGVGYGDKHPAISLGIISAVNRMGGRAIQTDANTSPANYGGPLVDIQGRVYGVCVPLSPGGMSASAGVEWYDSGIGFAIPLAGMEAWIERMRRGEDIFPGIIGVTVQDNPNAEGVVVFAMVKDSPGAQAGLQKDDLLLEIDGLVLKSQADLQDYVKRKMSGETVWLTFRRGEEERQIQVTLAPHPDSQPKSLIPGLPPLEELR